MRKKKEFNEQDGAFAFNIHQKIKEREEERRRLFIENVKDLVVMFDSQYYKVILGNDPPPQWSGYLAQLEVYYSRAEVERWRKIYTKLTKEFELKPVQYFDIPQTRLENIAKIATKENVLEWLDKARTIVVGQDWRDEIAEALGKPTSNDCKHHLEVFRICAICGLKARQNVKDESGDKKI